MVQCSNIYITHGGIRASTLIRRSGFPSPSDTSRPTTRSLRGEGVRMATTAPAEE